MCITTLHTIVKKKFEITNHILHKSYFYAKF